jgi:hypothetical protein
MVGAAAAIKPPPGLEGVPGLDGAPGIGANFGNYVNAARSTYTLATTDNKLPALLNFVGSALNLDNQNPLTDSFLSAAADVISGIQNPTFETLLNAITGIAAYAKAIEKKHGTEAAKQALKEQQLTTDIIALLKGEPISADLQLGITNIAIPASLTGSQAEGLDWKHLMGQVDAGVVTLGFAGVPKDDLNYELRGGSGNDLDLLYGDGDGDDPASDRLLPTANPSVGGAGVGWSFHEELEAGTIKLSLTELGPELNDLGKFMGSADGNGMFFTGSFLDLINADPGTWSFKEVGLGVSFIETDVDSGTFALTEDQELSTQSVTSPLNGEVIEFDSSQEPKSLNDAKPGDLVLYGGIVYVLAYDGRSLVRPDGSEAILLEANAGAKPAPRTRPERITWLKEELDKLPFIKEDVFDLVRRVNEWKGKRGPFLADPIAKGDLEGYINAHRRGVGGFLRRTLDDNMSKLFLAELFYELYPVVSGADGQQNLSIKDMDTLAEAGILRETRTVEVFVTFPNSGNLLNVLGMGGYAAVRVGDKVFQLDRRVPGRVVETTVDSYREEAPLGSKTYAYPVYMTPEQHARFKDYITAKLGDNNLYDRAGVGVRNPTALVLEALIASGVFPDSPAEMRFNQGAGGLSRFLDARRETGRVSMPTTYYRSF